jgi:TonB-linked SusC/RagA family outer membrane protein
MRVTSGVFILATVLLSAAQAHSVSGQNVLDQRLSLNVKDESLQQVLKKIQLLAKVNFTYKSVDVTSPGKVTLSVRDRELKYILNSVLAPAGLEYAVANKNIVIRKKVHVAQDVDIKGTVTSDAGEALPGASVIVKGTSIGTTTDADGSFALRVPDDGVLVVSFIGFTVYEEAVGNKVFFEIKLTADATQLQDIVVVGYGSAKKSEVLGAVSTVSTREVSSRNYNTAAELMQGTVPGVTVMNNGGDPTATPDIKIRGIGSLNVENPLIVLDGVIYSGSISMINPNEVESMTVLKDAATAAIYGARASAGVILINTKKGNSSGHVEVNYQQGFQQVAKKLEALNAAERADAANLATDNAGLDRIPAFDATLNPNSRISKTNWMDEIFRTGIINNLDVSMGGGNQKSNYFISGSYRRNEGILLNTDAQRYTARINSSHEILKGVRIGENLSYSFWNGQTGNTSSAYTGAIMAALYYPANATVYREDGSGRFGGVPDEYSNAYGDLINPVAYLKRLDVDNPTSTLLINPYLEVDILKGLKFRSNWGLTQNRLDAKQFNVKILETGKIFDFNELYETSTNEDIFLTEQTLSYDKTLGDNHHFSILAGTTYQRNKVESFSVKGTDFDKEDDQYRYLINAKTIQVLSSGGQEQIILSYLARANYNYKGKYLLTAVVRRDGTSKLLSSNRWETYPSVSVGWNIVQESFLQDVNIISDLKLRASWGVNGNLGSLPEYPFAIGLTRTRAWLGQDPQLTYGYAETAISNPDLKWESSEQQNIGLDFGLLEGQLTGSLDVFKKTNSDMLFKKVLPGTAGAPDGQWINGGEVVNRGFELGVTYRKNRGDLTYDVTANVSHVKNKIEFITDDNKFQNAGPAVRTMPQANINQVGSAYGSFYGYKTAGIFKSNEEAVNYVNADGKRYQPSAVAGDFKFIDSNTDGTIDNADRVVLGNPMPSLTYSLNGNLAYKGFDLNIFFQGVHGNSIFNSARALGLNAGYGYNLLAESRNAWSPENPDATIPRLSMKDPNNNWTRISDFFIEDGSFLRLKSVTLGYTLQNELLNRVKVRLYVTAQNLFTITDYSGMDPEVGIANYGVDTGMYPLSRVFLAGINLKF